jgi:hypothetical protein
MSTEEEWVQKVLRNVVKNAVQTYLMSQEYSSKFLTRIDANVINSDIENITDGITAKFVQKLKAKGYLREGLSISEEDFASVFRSTMEEYLSDFESGRK